MTKVTPLVGAESLGTGTVMPSRAMYFLTIFSVILFSQPQVLVQSQLANVFLTPGIVGALVVISNRSNTLRRMSVSPLVVSLVFLVGLSIFYTASRQSTASQLAVLVCITIAGMIVGNSLTMEQICGAIAWAGFFILCVSVITALINPGYGLQSGEYQAGSLRGIYSHRNILAFTLIVPLTAVIGMSRTRWQVRMLLAVCLSLGILSTNSSTALGCTAALVFVYSLFRFLAVFKSGYRLVPTLLIMPVLALGVVAANKYWEQILLILGRDSTFTGRSYIWAAVNEVSDRQAMFGYGWGGVWNGSWVQQYVSSMVGFHVPHAHSGYLDARIQLGYLGLSLIVLIMVVLFVRGTWLALRTGYRQYIFVPICIVLFAIYNVFETRITLPASIFVLVILTSHTLAAHRSVKRA